ncbi:MAG: hypothetical protein KC420_01700 [Myxococcales bacterium]|nr:hypothetical protein [Myxococcales bacterium]
MRPLLSVFALALAFAACALPPPPQAPREAVSPRPDPSIRSLDDAIERYKAELYAEAAWGCAEVAAGRLAGDPQLAAFWLAKSYFRLEDHRRAAAILKAIAAEPEHPAYLLSLPWLFQLHLEDLDDRQVLQAIGSYDLSVLEHPDLIDMADDFRVAFAAYRLSVGDIQVAYALAADVGADAFSFAESQLIAGLAVDRMGRRQEAIARLQAAAREPPKPPRRVQRRQRRRGYTPSRTESAEAEVRARARHELALRGAPMAD